MPRMTRQGLEARPARRSVAAVRRPPPLLASVGSESLAPASPRDALQDAPRQPALAQARLEATSRMAAIGQLAAGVAHEIRNPVGYVQSNLATLERGVAGIFGLLDRYERAFAAVATPALAQEIAAARRAADIEFLRADVPALVAQSRDGLARVAGIVRSLRGFAHSGAQEPWAPADLNAELAGTLAIAGNALQEKVRVIRAFGSLPAVECQSARLNQVFLNLLVNAAQAIPERGTIRVTTGSDGREAWVEVADDGPGIAARDLPHIFEPFYTTKAVGEGTGLGLALALGIVHEHRGRIDVASTPGRGTVFRVVVPVARGRRTPRGARA